MKLIIFLLLLQCTYAADSTFTVTLKGKVKTFTVPKDIYVNLREFRKFAKTSDGNSFSEIITNDVTGDGLKDSVINTGNITSQSCYMLAKIISKGVVVYADTMVFTEDDVFADNIWGNESFYNSLFPYSLLYNAYLNRMEFYKWSRETLDDKIFMPLAWKQSELEEQNLSKAEIESGVNSYKQYIYNYKGKFIRNLSPAEYDIYIYDNKLNKFVIFYTP